MSAFSVPVVVLDDHPMVVLGLRTLFHNRPEVKVVAYAHDADAALEACRAHRPRVALLDVTLEGSPVDGIGVCRSLRSQFPEVEVVFYTGRDELGLARRLYDAGAKGIVSKGDPSTDLLRAVLLVSRGKNYTSPAFAARAALADFDELSPKQLAVLQLLAQGLDRKEMAERLGVGEETVKTHLAEVRRKLGARTSAQAVAIGLVNALFEPAPDDADGDAAS
jgi:DNA-binding NarL/FixJ family response regulator